MERKSLWSELRRRHVVRVATLYGAVAFVVLQAADLIVPALGLPDWSFTLAVVVALVGFPVSLLLAWVFDVTPDGIRRTDDASRAGSAASPWSPVRLLVILTAILGVGGASWLIVSTRLADAPRVAPAADARSIAVLPFADMSPGADQAYLGDGLAEELLNLLTRVEGLRVAARTSAFAFRGVEADIREIGDQLGVANVLEGSVRRDGNRVRVTAQLIDVETGFHRWSDTYDEQLTDVFQIQDKIARAITERLELALIGESPDTEPPSADAIDAYLRGRFHWNKRTAGGMALAIAHFRKAVEEAPDYARAHAGLADAYALLPVFGVDVDTDRAWRDAQVQAELAVSLDPGLAEAHASAGLIAGFRYQLDEAVDHFEEAIRLNPGYASAHHWFSLILTELGHHERAVSEAREALALDPLSVAIGQDLAIAMLFAGDADGAVQQLERTLEAEPGFDSARWALAVALHLAGRYEAARLAVGDWAEATGRPRPPFEQALADAARFSETGRAGPAPDSLRSALEGAGLPAGTLAQLYALMGDRERSIEWVDRAIEARAYADLFPAVNPTLDFLRGDPAFEGALDRIRGGGRTAATPAL